MRTYAHSRHGAPQPRHVAVAASPCAATRLRPESRVSAGSLQSLIPTQRESESLNSKLVLACMPSWAWRGVLASPRPSGFCFVACRVLSSCRSSVASFACQDPTVVFQLDHLKWSGPQSKYYTMRPPGPASPE